MPRRVAKKPWACGICSHPCFRLMWKAQKWPCTDFTLISVCREVINELIKRGRGGGVRLCTHAFCIKHNHQDFAVLPINREIYTAGSRCGRGSPAFLSCTMRSPRKESKAGMKSSGRHVFTKIPAALQREGWARGGCWRELGTSGGGGQLALAVSP